MEKLRQCESIFIDITCISGTTIRTQELPRHTDISKHLPSTSVCCSVAQSCLTLCDPEDFSPPGSPVLHHLPEFAHTHAHCSPYVFTQLLAYLKYFPGFPNDSGVKSLPDNAGDSSSISDPGRSHMPWSNPTCVPQLLSLCSRARECQLRSPEP